MIERRVALPLDHVGWLVDDLDAVTAAYAELGFNVTRPETLKTGPAVGPSVDVGQRSAHAMFADTYVELTALTPGSRPEHLQPYLNRAGLVILALRVDNAASARESLEAAGLAVSRTSRSERLVAYAEPAEQGIAAFAWFMCAATDFPEMLVCCVEHLTPGLLFQPGVCRHDNGAAALQAVFLFEPDPDSASRRFSALASGLTVDANASGGCLILLDAAAAAARFPGIDPPGEHGYGIGIGLQVPELGSVASRLTRAGIAFVQSSERIWCASPSGGVLEFRI